MLSRHHLSLSSAPRALPVNFVGVRVTFSNRPEFLLRKALDHLCRLLFLRARAMGPRLVGLPLGVWIELGPMSGTAP